jgi:hypothetical protein
MVILHTCFAQVSLLSEPLYRFHVTLENNFSYAVYDHQAELCLSESIISRLSAQSRRLRVTLRHAIASKI